MKKISIYGLTLFWVAFVLFNLSMFLSHYNLTPDSFKSSGLSDEQVQYLFNKRPDLQSLTFSKFELMSTLGAGIDSVNKMPEPDSTDLTIWGKQDIIAAVAVSSASGIVTDHKWLFFFLIFGGLLIGPLVYVFSAMKFKRSDNTHIYYNSLTNKGVLAYLLAVYFIGFYFIIYFYPAILSELIVLTDPLCVALSGNHSSNWFVYGIIYTCAILIMGLRFIFKYRNIRYQVLRTISVMFFQTIFAFLIPQFLTFFKYLSVDFKSMWPLDYYFFFQSSIEEHMHAGLFGHLTFFWGIALFAIVLPIMTYFFGKRWYCSWVCGCGALAETAGDPFRQLSSKKTSAWKLERISIYSVLSFSVFMTIFTLYAYFTAKPELAGIKTEDIQSIYGFYIGIMFAGFIGTAFYPILGNRTWCRFGCPLAAYLGIVQRFKSRFRITTNGGQCISCGNCSIYCEMGIDVRSYAQKGQNIVRGSCVGCGICSAVCPRGVLKLENGTLKGRIKENKI